MKRNMVFLEYLVNNDTEAIIARIYDVMFSHQNQVREAAFYSLMENVFIWC